MNKIIQAFRLNLIFWRSKYIKKEKNIWVFGAIQGKEYMDNAKYLYEYVNQNTDITAIWLTTNNNIIRDLESKGLNAFHMHSKKGIAYAMRAKVAVITHRGCNRNADLPFYAFSKETKIIQLWHGVPLKKIAFDDKLFSFKINENSLRYKIRRYLSWIYYPYNKHLHKPDMIVAVSDETKTIMSDAFRVPEKTVIVTGYPRNDALFKENSLDVFNKQIIRIIYMPTFRGEFGERFDLYFQYGFNAKDINRYLEEKNAQLYLKFHRFNRPSASVLKSIMFSKNIKYLDCNDIYEQLATFNILITDYSSIYFDFLLTEKPIIFAPFDLERYNKNDREFYFEYDEVTPGPKAMNWQEVIKLIQYYIDDPQLFLGERQEIARRFHKYLDANSSERTFNAIQKLIE